MHGADTDLGNGEKLGGVREAPVAKFMTKNSNNLLRFTLLNQGVVDDNMFLPWQTEKVGITVGASLASINDVQRLERKLELVGESLDACLEFSRFERGQLVEQRQDEDRVDGDGRELNDDSKEPKVVEEACACDLDDLQESTQQGCAESNGQGLALD